MANRRITDLPAISSASINDDDLLMVVDVAEVDPGLKNKKLNFSDTKQYFNAYYLQLTGGTIAGSLVVSNNLTVSGSFSPVNITVTGSGVFNDIVVTGSGRFTNYLSGNTITGGSIQGLNINATTGNVTTLVVGTETVGTGTFTRISGITITGTSGLFTTGSFLQISGTTGLFSSLSGTNVTGVNIIGTTQISGAIVTGNTGRFSNITGVSGVFTTRLSGATITGDTVLFTTATGATGTFTRVSGTTVTGATGLFTQLTGGSGTFVQVSGATITGATGLFTNLTGSLGTFTNQISGAIVTGVTGQFTNLQGVSGVFTSQVSGSTITGNTVLVSTLTGVSGTFVRVSGTTVTGITGLFQTVTALTGTFINTISIPSISTTGDIIAGGNLFISGNSTFSSGIIVSGQISGNSITGITGTFGDLTSNNIYGLTSVSGNLVTGVTGAFTQVTATTGTFTTRLSGNTITGNSISGTSGVFVSGIFTNVSGTVVTGNAGRFSEITGVSGTFTSNISGQTVTGVTGSFTSLNGVSGVFTDNLSGSVITGDTSRFTTLSGITGVFTSTLSGATVTGGSANFTSITGVNATIANTLSGATVTGSNASFTRITGVSGVFTTQLSGQNVVGENATFNYITGTTRVEGGTISGATVTGNVGLFTNLTGVSGVFTSRVSGAYITGVTIEAVTVTAITGNFTTANFTQTTTGNILASGFISGVSGLFTASNVSGIGSGIFGGGVFTTGTVSGTFITGQSGQFQTLSGTTVTGATGLFTSITGVSGVFTSQLSGTVITGDTGNFNTLNVETAIISTGIVKQNITVTGNIQTSGTLSVGQTATIASGLIVSAGTISGVTFTGASGQFTVLTGSTAGFTTITGTTITGATGNFIRISGTTITGETGQFNVLTGNTAGFTTVTGTTVTGTTAQFVSGLFSSGLTVTTGTISGFVITGVTGQFTTLTGGTAGFTTVTGTTVTGTTANFVTGTFTTILSGATITGNTGSFTTITGATGVFTSFSGTTVNVATGVFAAGTAASPSITFSGDLDTGIYSPGADQVAISTGGSGRLFIDASGRLLVGTSTARSNFFGTTLSSLTQTEGIGGSTARGALSVINNDVSNNPPYVLLGRSGAATVGSNAAVVSGSRLGTLTFHGADGTSFIEAATVAGEVDGTPGTNDMPGRLVFSTTADGASSPTERLRIDSSGRLLVGTSSSSADTLFRVQGKQSSSASNGVVQIARGQTNPSSDNGLGHIQFTDAAGSIGASIIAETELNWGASDYPTRLVFSTTADGASSPTERLRIDSAGTTTLTSAAATAPFIAKISTAEVARIDSSGRLLVGTTSTYNVASTVGATLQAVATSSVLTGSFTRYTNDNDGAIIALGKSRGTSAGSFTVVQSGDIIGNIRFAGADGGDLETQAASIRCEVDGTPGANDMPGRLVFSTTADGAASPTERLRITSAGLVGIGTANADSYDGRANNLVIYENGDTGITIATNGTSYGSIYFADGTVGNQLYRGVIEYNHNTDYMAFWTAATEKVRLDSSGRLLVGTSTAQSGTRSQYSKFTVQGNNQSTSDGAQVNLASNTDAASLATGYTLGQVIFTDNGPGEYGKIACQMDGAGAGTNDYPGRLVFSTTADGASSPTERMRIDSSGRVGIGVTSPQTLLHLASGSGVAAYATFSGNNGSPDPFLIGQDASGLTRLFQTAAQPISFWTNSTERARIDSSGRLLVGTSSARTNFFNSGVTSTLQVDDALGIASVIRGANDAFAGTLVLGHTRSTTNTIVQSADAVGSLSFQGNDGTDFVEAANISAFIDGTPGANDMPGRLVFSTTADGAASPTERMRISQNGVITIKNGAVAEIGTLTDGVTITPDFAANCNFTVTLGGNRTLANPTNVTAGQSGSIFIVQDGTGGRTLSWGANWDWSAGAAPTLTTTANAVDRVDYVCRSATSIHAVYSSNYS